MTPADVPLVVAGQEPAAVAGLGEVFPQDLYPFPRDAVARRWREEVADPGIDCFVILRRGQVAGFAATRGEELAHFGVVLEEWGSGLAVAAHDELLAGMRERGVTRAWLRVYAANPRGRAFWDGRGWTDTGERSRGRVPPYAEMLILEREL